MIAHNCHAIRNLRHFDSGYLTEIYDIVMFFINQGSQVVELVNAVIEAITAIASGAVGGAAKLVENALARSLFFER
jgi:hypothetical protein